MRVLVTGHKGYVGSVLVPMLVDAGHDVVGSDADFFRACHFAGELCPVPDLGADVRDLDTTALRGFDAVIHLAGLSNDPLSDRFPGLTGDINAEASIRLAQAAREAAVGHFVFASSCSCYGIGSAELLDEDSPCQPLTPYARSKLEVEQALSGLPGRSFTTTVIRAGTVYGVSPRIRFDLVLNNLVAWVAATGEVRLKSDGRAWRPLIHVSDLARAYCAVLQAPRSTVHGRIYNAGRSDQNFLVRDLAGMIGQQVPDARVVVSDQAGEDPRNYRVNCDRIRAEVPAFRPAWTAQQGVIELLNAFREHPAAIEDVEGTRFNRLRHLEWLLASGALDNDLRWARAATRQRN